MLPSTIPGAGPQNNPLYTPYYGNGSSNQVYSNSLQVLNVPADGDGMNQPSRPYIPDSSNSVGFAAFGAVPNANGGSAAGNIITLQPADATHPGGVSTSVQSFGGNKTFTGSVTAASLTTAGSVTAASLAVSGNISAGSLDPVNYINLPATSAASVGVIKQAGARFIHTYGTNNLSIGSGGLNLTTTGNGNVNIGASNMASATSATASTGVGLGALRAITSATGSTAVGNSAGFSITTGNINTLYGLNSGSTITTGSGNVCFGPNTGTGLIAQSNVTEVGDGTLKVPAAGDLILGQSATTACYISGIAGVTPAGTPQNVIIDPVTKQLGSTAAPAAGVGALSAIGAVPNANGATITGTTLNLQPADGSFGGVLTTGVQTIAGVKTLSSNLIGVSIDPINYINVPTTSGIAVGVYRIGNFSALHIYGTNNAWCGQGTGNFGLTGTGNTACGTSIMQSLTNGGSNTAVGNSAGHDLIGGSNNTLLGAVAGFFLTSGSNNIAVGSGSLPTQTTASNMIEIGNGTLGTAITGDIRIGTSSSLACYLAGIGTTAVGGTPRLVTINTANSQLGSMVMPTYTASSAVYTPTCSAGVIAGMTSNGAATATITISYTVSGNVVTVKVPQMTWTTLASSPVTITATGAAGSLPAGFRPTNAMNFPISVNRATPEIAHMWITGGGIITFERISGGNWASGNAMWADFAVSFVI